MPIYEYRCKECNHVFETFQRSNANDLDLHCPHCGAAAVERIFSAFASTGSSTASSSSTSSSGCGSGGFT